MTPNEWSGPVGDLWAQEWRRTDRSFTQLTERLNTVVRDAAPETGRVVDIGCGAGETSIALATAHPGLSVVGIDISRDLLAVARTRAAACPNLSFHEGDAAAGAAGFAPVDLYISRHGVMFFDDPAVAFARLREAAAEGARLVFSCFRDWRSNGFYAAFAEDIGVPPPEPRAPGPFAFADRDYVTALLGQAGWRDVDAEPVDFAYRAGAGDDPVTDAASYLSRIGPAARAIRDAPEERRPELRERVRTVMDRHHRGGVVDFPAAAWIWSARA